MNKFPQKEAPVARISIVAALLIALVVLAWSSETALCQFPKPKIPIDIDNTPLDPHTWDPSKWVKEGGVVFSGRSGREYKLEYTIKNTTDKTVSLTFRPTENTAILKPGETTTCRSPAKMWGNEKNGIKHLWPQVTAVPRAAGKGSGWMRTIMTDGGKYFIVDREEGGVQVVP